MSAALQFRLAEAQETRALFGHSSATPLLEALLARGAGLLALIEGAPVGITVSLSDAHRAEILSCSVAAEHRGRGYARAMLDALRGEGERCLSALVRCDEPAEFGALHHLVGPVQRTYFGYSMPLPGSDTLAAQIDIESSVRVRAIEFQRDAAILSSLDALAGRAQDPVLHEALASLAEGLLFERSDGEAVAYVYAHPDGAIGPAAASGGRALTSAILYACERLRRCGAERMRLWLPAQNADLPTRVLHECGARVFASALLLGEPEVARGIDLPLCDMLRGEPTGRSSAW